MEKWYNRWLCLLTKLLTGPDLHCVEPLALWRFLQNLLAKHWQRPEKKSYHLRAGPLVLCHMVHPLLVNALRSQKGCMSI